MANLGNTGNTKNTGKYFCEKCDVTTSHKNNFAKHCQTIKHIGNTMEIPKPSHAHTCTLCLSEFVTYAGLWKHAKKCPQKCPKPEETLVEFLKQENKELKTTMLQIIDMADEKMTTALKEVIKDNNENVTKLVIDLCKNAAPITNVNVNNDHCNTMINSNNKFNLNFFLNETCKDALNLSEFISNIKSSFEDIETIGNMGYVDGTSNFIIKHLNELGVEKRPIQCTDAKRQTLYIKENDQWTKEDNTTFANMQKLVDEVQKINLRQLPSWQKAHPNCLTSFSRFTDTYNHMSQELMGGECQKVKLHIKDHRIFNKIMKEMTIDKHVYAMYKG